MSETGPIRVYPGDGEWLVDYGSYVKGHHPTREEAVTAATLAAGLEHRDLVTELNEAVAAAHDRAEAADVRDQMADERDAIADLRDAAADERDRAADARDERWPRRDVGSRCSRYSGQRRNE
jgi:hypothetical protein